MHVQGAQNEQLSWRHQYPSQVGQQIEEGLGYTR